MQESQQSALARESQKEEDRIPYHLYVDEFQNFQVESFDEIMSESRKYKLYLLIAHQRLSQITEQLQDAVSMAGTRIAFQVHQDDERKVKSIMNVSSAWFGAMAGNGCRTSPSRIMRSNTSRRISVQNFKKACRTLYVAPRPVLDPSQLREVAKAHVDWIDGAGTHHRDFLFENITFEQEEYPEKTELPTFHDSLLLSGLVQTSTSTGFRPLNAPIQTR